MRRVGIITRKITNSNYKESYSAISNNWLNFFNNLKIEPILITEKITKPINYFKTLNCSCLFLLNGEDTKLKVKNGKFISGSDRDFVEFKLLKHCLKKKFPILGICRGHQFINIYFEGKIKKINNHVNKSHKIKIIDQSIKEKLKLNYMGVNSFHNFGIYRDDLSKKLSPWAITDDTIEGYLSQKYKILTMIWHPERRKIINKNELRLIKDLLRN